MPGREVGVYSVVWFAVGAGAAGQLTSEGDAATYGEELPGLVLKALLRPERERGQWTFGPIFLSR